MQVMKIADLNALIKEYVESNDKFKSICVEGEASNITYQQRHLYFTLKDENANISCCAFSYIYSNDIPRDMKEGDKVIVYGSLNVYKASAKVQIVTNKIEKVNMLGNLYIKKEELTKLYKQKGYFDESLKKKLPIYPKTIGIVSSHTGAAIHDIINTTHKRNNTVDIYVYSAKVQGEGASQEVANGIKYFNNCDFNIDCIIVGRGGGSIEDLWAFNEVEIIEAIHESNIPVISAVGHEIDFLISDFVADKRASTPTQAAEILIPLKKDILENLKALSEKANKELLNCVEKNKHSLELLKKDYRLDKFYSNQIIERINLLETLQENLKKAFIYRISPKNKKIELNMLASKLDIKLNSKLQGYKNMVSELGLKLEKFDVFDILNRGYTITLKGNKILKNARIKKGDKLKTIYSNNKFVESVVE